MFDINVSLRCLSVVLLSTGISYYLKSRACYSELMMLVSFLSSLILFPAVMLILLASWVITSNFPYLSQLIVTLFGDIIIYRLLWLLIKNGYDLYLNNSGFKPALVVSGLF